MPGCVSLKILFCVGSGTNVYYSLPWYDEAAAHERVMLFRMEFILLQENKIYSMHRTSPVPQKKLYTRKRRKVIQKIH